ncbi:MAG: arsenate reductase ArsC [Ktedonobacterales bacterium]
MTTRVLFLCTHNSARSQMAQGLLNWLAPERYTAFSAGTHPTRQHPLAVKVMAELGINILPQGVHALSDYTGQSFDLVVTVCDQAAEECPVFPGAAEQLHWGFADPSVAGGTEEGRLRAFRHTRDLILVRLQQWLAQHGEPVTVPTASGAPSLLATDGSHPHAADTAHLSLPSQLTPPTRVLIMCTGNSARSQMAEAWLRYLGGSEYAAFSAGTHPTSVNPLAIRVMAERYIDISQARSKSVAEFLDQPFDYVITVCDRAAEQCPIFPGIALRLHWSFPDPAAVTGSDADRVQAFRTVRDGLYFQFWRWITDQLPAELEQEQLERAEEHK